MRARAIVLAALAIVPLAGGCIGGSDSEPRRSGAVPSPLFDDVEQLTLETLPDNWSRCAGGPSTLPEATERSWAQTFGPVVEGECEPLVTVTQIPPEDDVRIPKGATNGGIGKKPGRTGAKHWADQETGSRGLYTTGSGGLQLLVVEGCCTDAATGETFLQVAEAARDATREQEPAHCTGPYSDLDQESFLTNYFARSQRAVDRKGCPVRGDIVSWRTEPPTAHCFAGVRTLTVGNPVGAPYGEADGRTYARDPEGQLRSGQGPDPRLDLDALLPGTAVDTGFHQGDQTIWVDEADDGVIYLVSDDHVEAWPLDPEQHVCA